MMLKTTCTPRRPRTRAGATILIEERRYGYAMDGCRGYGAGRQIVAADIFATESRWYLLFAAVECRESR